MDKKSGLLNKTLVIGILVLLIGAGIIPTISGDYNNNQDTFSLTFYTFDKTGTKKCKVEISTDSANIISDMFEELKYKITSDPTSDETKSLKNDFVEILDSYGLIPQGLSKDYVFSLLNPRWLRNTGNNNPFTKDSVPSSRVSTVRNGILPGPYSHTGSAAFCSLAGGGGGFIFPPVMLPRPRLATVWAAYLGGVITAANLFTGHGFVAYGAQFGVALGFMGIGLSFAYPGEPSVFGFGGYALLAMVGAEDVESYPPNQDPVISDENPPSGTWDVPLSLSELRFHISDDDGDLMSYWVTTDPDIGSGQGHLKNNGVYSVPVSSLEYDKPYSWTVRVSDGKETVEKKFGFITVAGPPFDPFDDGWEYRKMITIDHNKVAGSLTGFPVLVSVVDSDLHDKAQSDGDDILFMDGSGVATKLYHEIEMYDDSSGELITWVSISSLSSTIDTVLYMYYGNPSSNSQQFPERVWDSDYIMVQHMDIQDSTIYDSTLNDNDGYLVSSPYNIDGVISNAVQFDGKDDAIEVPYDSTLESPDLTFELWGRITGSRSDGKPHNYFALKRGRDHWGNNDGHQFSFQGYWQPESGTRRFRALYERNSAPQQHAVGDSVGLNNTWYHFSTTFDEDTYNAKFYMNGSLKATEPMESEVIWYNDNSGFSWAKDYRPTPLYMHVSVDETRISSVVRSAEWTSTSFNTMSDPLAFFSLGPEESAP